MNTAPWDARITFGLKIFTTGFVLRYTPFIQKIKDIIKSGEIGEIITMQLNENEGFWHHAHSYVRGPWSNEAESSPLIVAKSCHDFDLMLYLIDFMIGGYN